MIAHRDTILSHAERPHEPPWDDRMILGGIAWLYLVLVVALIRFLLAATEILRPSCRHRRRRRRSDR